MKYRIITNGHRFKVQRHIPWYKSLPFGYWKDASWEYKTKEDAQYFLDIRIKESGIANLKWREVKPHAETSDDCTLR